MLRSWARRMTMLPTPAALVEASLVAPERLPERFGGEATIIAVGAKEGRAGQTPGFLRRAKPGRVPFDQVAAAATDESRRDLAARRIEPTLATRLSQDAAGEISGMPALPDRARLARSCSRAPPYPFAF